MTRPSSIDPNALAEISADELATVSAGASRGGSNFFGFLDGFYKKVVFGVAGHMGGNKLAEKMYGSHVTSRDKSRAQAAMKQFLVAGNKLPRGVPNLFG